MADRFNGLLSLDRKIVTVSPGAYLISASTGAFPIFTSVTDYSEWGMDNLDDKYIVLPGYKIIIYTNTNYEGVSTTIDNTAGLVTIVQSLVDTDSINTHINRGSSCQLFHGSTQI